MIFAWAAIYHSSMAGKRDENPFKAYQHYFVLINSAVSIAQFTIYVWMSQADLSQQETLYEMGVVIISVVSILFGIFFIRTLMPHSLSSVRWSTPFLCWQMISLSSLLLLFSFSLVYGSLLVRTLTKDFASPYARKLFTVAVSFSVCFFATSAISLVGVIRPELYGDALTCAYFAIDIAILCIVIGLFNQSVTTSVAAYANERASTRGVSITRKAAVQLPHTLSHVQLNQVADAESNEKPRLSQLATSVRLHRDIASPSKADSHTGSRRVSPNGSRGAGNNYTPTIAIEPDLLQLPISPFTKEPHSATLEPPAKSALMLTQSAPTTPRRLANAGGAELQIDLTDRVDAHCPGEFRRVPALGLFARRVSLSPQLGARGILSSSNPSSEEASPAGKQRRVNLRRYVALQRNRTGDSPGPCTPPTFIQGTNSPSIGTTPIAAGEVHLLPPLVPHQLPPLGWSGGTVGPTVRRLSWSLPCGERDAASCKDTPRKPLDRPLGLPPTPPIGSRRIDLPPIEMTPEGYALHPMPRATVLGSMRTPAKQFRSEPTSPSVPIPDRDPLQASSRSNCHSRPDSTVPGSIEYEGGILGLDLDAEPTLQHADIPTPCLRPPGADPLHTSPPSIHRASSRAARFDLMRSVTPVDETALEGSESPEEGTPHASSNESTPSIDINARESPAPFYLTDAAPLTMAATPPMQMPKIHSAPPDKRPEPEAPEPHAPIANRSPLVSRAHSLIAAAAALPPPSSSSDSAATAMRARLFRRQHRPDSASFSPPHMLMQINSTQPESSTPTPTLTPPYQTRSVTHDNDKTPEEKANHQTNEPNNQTTHAIEANTTTQHT